MDKLIAAALILPLGSAGALAQTMDVSGYRSIEDIDVVVASGETVGEIEKILIDGSGTPVAAVVEINDGFLNLGDTEVVVNLSDLTWEDGQYSTALTEGQIESLPVWDD